ncbi:pirin family protein [Allorhizocola rhizosphaerae]|uniref:pirin family protein n=1 Tax=Allorhizocola rhizosphaerae TaxID=1872709 RepID=UPI000E3DB2B1|nr:pirin family protein [Allorhizocola rhizosphaerae]
MSNVETAPAEELCGGDAVADQTFELLHEREVVLGTRDGTTVTRTLPNKDRRMVGAWCFLDAYGPTDIAGKPGMQVAAHPHTGLQTVSWLLAGEVRHHDSLGSNQLIRPGQLNLMTSGQGIAHAELSPPSHGDVLQGVQLWVALPRESAAVDPDFAHHADLPVIDAPGATTTVIMGSIDGAASPARTFSPLVGAEIAVETAATIPLRKDFEHAVLVMSGEVEVGLVTLRPGPLLYLGRGRADLRIMARRPSRVLLLGGEPFDEEIVMWWNFVGRSHDEIVHFRQLWESGSFAPVTGGYAGGIIPAPPLPTTPLKPRGRVRPTHE